MRRIGTSNLIQWGGIGLVIVLAVILLWTTGSLQFSNPRQVLAGTASFSPSPTPTPSPAPLPGEGADTTTPTPLVEPAVAYPELPEITPPPGGQVCILVPSADAVGWVRQDDESPNHFGDYNVYAGVFEDLIHLGAIQFDLSQIPPGAPIVHADLVLVGLTEEWLGGEANWSAQLLEPWLSENWSERTFAELSRDESVSAELETVLPTGDLRAGRANLFVLGPDAREALELRTLTGLASFRIKGPTEGTDNLFSWDSGYGAESRGWTPLLRVAAGPAPDAPPASPTPQYVIITSTPTPENILTRAAIDASATAQVTTTGTATPFPANWVTPIVVVPTGTPANAATAEWHAAVNTAVAAAYGTPTPWPPNVWTATPTPLVVVTSTPTPLNLATGVAWAEAEATRWAMIGTPTPLPPHMVTATPRSVVVTNTPTPENQATAEAIQAQATIVVLQVGTATPTPANWVTATPTSLFVVTNTPTPHTWATALAQAKAEATRWATTGTPTPFPDYVVTATPDTVVVTSTPTPQNQATAEAIQAQATIVALRVGTFTPTPPSWVTATPLPLLQPFDEMTPTPTPTATPGPCGPLPDVLRGRIAFVSDRLGKPQRFAMDPDGSNVAVLTQPSLYDVALGCEVYAPGRLRRVLVQPGDRGLPQLFLEDLFYGTVVPLTRLAGMAYDPAWAPAGEGIAFVSTEADNDEVYVISADGTDLRRLTFNTWEWDKHPSWSPDGSQIVFYSNRETGRRQIWLMNADGTVQKNISNNEYNDWDPVWIK